MEEVDKVVKVLNDAITANKNYPWAKTEVSFEFIEMLIELLKELKKENESLGKDLTDSCDRVRRLRAEIEKYHKADTFLEAHGWKWE